MKKKFTELTRDEALRIIHAFAFRYSQTHNDESAVFDLICKWNDANPEEPEIFGCWYDDTGFNENVIGFMVEDDWYIYADYREEYQEYLNRV